VAAPTGPISGAEPAGVGLLDEVGLDLVGCC